MKCYYTVDNVSFRAVDPDPVLIWDIVHNLLALPLKTTGWLWYGDPLGYPRKVRPCLILDLNLPESVIKKNISNWLHSLESLDKQPSELPGAKLTKAEAIASQWASTWGLQLPQTAYRALVSILASRIDLEPLHIGATDDSPRADTL
jgi:hypothetical protein